MKSSICSFILATVFTVALHAQETIDSARFWAGYRFYAKSRPELTEYDQFDWRYLDVGDKATVFYSRYGEIRDSIRNEGLKKGLSAWELYEETKGYPQSGTTPTFYQLYNEKKTRSAVRYISGYVAEEPMMMPEWRLHEDTMTVLGYLCKRATTHYLGRDWEVYYALDIPLSLGPWKLWGLPGLITRAEDADHYFLFELAVFEQIDEPIPLFYIHREFGSQGGYKGAEYRRVSKKTYLEYERLYHEDAIAFGNFEMGSTPTVFDENGNPAPPVVRKKDYIPLEK